MTAVIIDPGYSKRSGGCAIALFDGERFTGHDVMRPPYDGRFSGVQTVVVERPQWDSRCMSDASSVIDLAWYGALLAGGIAAYHDATTVELLPREWKGSLPKPVTHKRMWDVLTPAERALLGGSKTLMKIETAVQRGASKRWPPGYDAYVGSTIHNRLDAVAIGLVWRGRVKFK